jgi:ketosteroid isomerase-like protein
MTDRELRELCHCFFDAIERRDVAAVAELYAPDFAFWTNLTGTESSREQNLATLRDGYALLRRRTYDDRRIDTLLSACIVAQCKDGRITHIDEYLDSSKFRRPAAGES